MAARQKIMIVDSDKSSANMIATGLDKERFEVKKVSDGNEAIREFQSYNPDLITLALILPGIDGYQVCTRIRSISRVPIIIISSKNEVFDKVLSLELGADDFITKPFDEKELAARVRAVLRRSDPQYLHPSGKHEDEPRDAQPPLKIVEYNDLSINLSNYSVICRGESIDMPPKEIELLYFLASSPNQVFTRDQLLSNIWGYEYAGDTRTVDVHIKRIREKIKDNPQWSINTVWGVGYRFTYRN